MNESQEQEQAHERPAYSVSLIDKQRRQRSTTLPHRGSALRYSTESALTITRRNEALALMHMDLFDSTGASDTASAPAASATTAASSTSRTVDLTDVLCSKCLLYVRVQATAVASTILAEPTHKAPPDIPSEDVTRYKSAQSAMRSLAHGRKEIVKQVENIRARSDSFSGAAAPRHQLRTVTPIVHDNADSEEELVVPDVEPRNGSAPSTPRGSGSGGDLMQSPGRTVEKVLEERRRDATILDAMIGRSCEYSWTGLNNSVWSGIADSSTREQMWVFQSAPHEISIVTALPPFETLLQNAFMPRITLTDILKDLYRTFDNVQDKDYFHSALYKGLVVHATLRPDIGYVQGMNCIWGILVLTISNPQHQLVIAEHLVRDILPYYFNTSPCLGAIIDGMVLAYYFKRQRPHDYEMYAERFKVTDSIGTDGDVETTMHQFFTSFCARNFTTLYGFSLPRFLVVRLWDLVMLRGASALFEFAIRSLHYFFTRGKLAKAEVYQQVVTMYTTMFAAYDTDAKQEKLYDTIAKVKLPLQKLIYEDLALRRRVAARIVFQRIRESGGNVSVPI